MTTRGSEASLLSRLSNVSTATASCRVIICRGTTASVRALGPIAWLPVHSGWAAAQYQPRHCGQPAALAASRRAPNSPTPPLSSGDARSAPSQKPQPLLIDSEAQSTLHPLQTIPALLNGAFGAPGSQDTDTTTTETRRRGVCLYSDLLREGQPSASRDVPTTQLSSVDLEDVPNFDALHSRVNDKRASACAFDVLMFDGEDLQRKPFAERKGALRKALQRTRRGIQYVAHTEGDGCELFEAVCKLGLEGIVSKKLNAPCRSGPSRTWVKVKNPNAPAATRATDGTF